MIKEIEYKLPPEIAYNEDELNSFLNKKYNQVDTGNNLRVVRRSVDARGKKVKVNVKVMVGFGEKLPPMIHYKKEFPHVSNNTPVVIVGFGPAGMFAALRLIELGFKPIVIERGGDVRARRRDLAAINKKHIVNPESNYCFGEGGAGTYSDGKLYTRSKKRGNFRRILEIFVAHGANENILVEAHPHIGTNKLPAIVQNIRQSILEAGGEIHFNTKVEDFLVKNNEIKGVVTHHGDTIEGIGVILATGHSARDIFTLLDRKKIHIESKPFAIGVRVEHAQSLIDRLQYHLPERGTYLPAAAYSLVSQVKYKGHQKGVFSFCMCPGGFIVPSATAPGEIVVNGMSPSRRDSKYANSGIVVPVEAQDLKQYAKYGALAGMYFQQEIEQNAFKAGGKTQTAPAQLLGDFVRRRTSSKLLETSYQPGLTPASIDSILPAFISERLRIGFKHFGKKMPGYLSNEAQIVATESRTSSPVRIPRDKETMEHVQVKRFFPCGEGAGFAGGIASAAMDGEACAESLVRMYGKKS